MLRSLLLAVLALTLHVAPATAQAPLSTDRPGLGFSPTTVGHGVFQAEIGLPSAATSSFGDAEVSSYGVPVVLRFGLRDDVEVRLATSVFDAVRVASDDETATDGQIGFEVLQVGAKWDLSGYAGRDLAVLPYVQIPTEGGDVGVGISAIGGWDLPNAFSLTTVAGVFGQGGALVGELVAVVGRGLTDTVGGYVETGGYPADGATPWYVGGGLTFLLSPDLQIDASLDRGLNDDASDWLFGAGLSFRLR